MAMMLVWWQDLTQAPINIKKNQEQNKQHITKSEPENDLRKRTNNKCRESINETTQAKSLVIILGMLDTLIHS
jgi:hypothetical protein